MTDLHLENSIFFHTSPTATVIKATPKTLISHCHQRPSSKTSGTGETNANVADSPSPRFHDHKLVLAQQNKRFVLLKILSALKLAWGDGPAAAAAAAEPSPVRSCPLWRQLHPIHRVVAVVIHDLRQAKVCDLDLSTSGAIHQQDVAWTINVSCFNRH